MDDVVTMKNELMSRKNRRQVEAIRRSIKELLFDIDCQGIDYQGDRKGSLFGIV